MPREFQSPRQLRETLQRLCHNLSWSWRPPLRDALRGLDPEGWNDAGGSAHRWARALKDARLRSWCADAEVLARVRRVVQSHPVPPAGETWWDRLGQGVPGPIAYFCAEFGIHEHLPVYAGGLGVLAGDHCKSASDLGLPLVAVGLLYREGYFRQSVDGHGWQVEVFDARRPEDLPLTVVRGAAGAPLRIPVPLWGRTVHVGVARADVGRVPVYLLDADVEENLPEDRGLTRHLYGGDAGMRIGQEVLLGVGGLRALRAMGIAPSSFHMNEGHSAFLGLERMREERASGASLADVGARAAARTVFTTHTPVPAGHDTFGRDLVQAALGGLAAEIGLGVDALMDLGRERPGDGAEPLCMTVLALRLSSRANAVSRRHGEVSRRMWQGLWPGRRPEEIPIGHVTNGVHAPTWLGEELQTLLDSRLGESWRRALPLGHAPLDLSAVGDDELWGAHQGRKRALVRLVRRRVAEQRHRLGAPAHEVEAASCFLSEDVLLIGFARRFATYKRADLLFQDYERAVRLLAGAERPVHLIFAGKAHPKDHPGKEVMSRIIAASRDPRLGGHVVFLEDYDLGLGRALVQGVDVWLNNPRRPKEASGTSGQKAAMNGVPNLSVLDGWWAEGYHPDVGWAIGGHEDDQDDADADRQDREALFAVLEQEVLPTYYERGADHFPRRFVEMMRASVATALPRFNTDRMVAEYALRYYLPAALGGGTAGAEDAA